MEQSCPLRTTRRVLQETFSRKPNNKSFIDQASSVKMAGYWPRSFLFCEFMDLDSVSVHKQAKSLNNSRVGLSQGFAGNDQGGDIRVCSKHVNLTSNQNYLLSCVRLIGL